MDVSALSSVLNSTKSTNTGYDGANVVSEDVLFQSALDEAANKLDTASKKNIKVMSQEEIDKRDKEIREASTELEALLLKMMYSEMYKTVPKDELFGDDNAMEIYQDMYNEEMTKQAAKDGGIGLADFIYQQLSK